MSKINNIRPKFGDGGLSIESWDEAFGGNIGFLLRPTPELKIGLTYNSPVDFKFGFHPFITNLGPGLRLALKKSGLLGAKVNLGQTEPMQFMASGLYQFTPEFAHRERGVGRQQRTVRRQAGTAGGSRTGRLLQQHHQFQRNQLGLEAGTLWQLRFTDRPL
jgi:hypothetical protein